LGNQILKETGFLRGEIHLKTKTNKQNNNMNEENKVWFSEHEKELLDKLEKENLPGINNSIFKIIFKNSWLGITGDKPQVKIMEECGFGNDIKEELKKFQNDNTN
jgi:hypothetical protein